MDAESAKMMMMTAMNLMKSFEQKKVDKKNKFDLKTYILNKNMFFLKT